MSLLEQVERLNAAVNSTGDAVEARFARDAATIATLRAELIKVRNLYCESSGRNFAERFITGFDIASINKAIEMSGTD